MSIIVNNSIVFLDSLQFCKASLDTLAGNQKYLKEKTHILMNGLILIKNLFIQDYHQKKAFIHQQVREKEVKKMDIFLLDNIYI